MGGMETLTAKYSDRLNELGFFLKNGYSKKPGQLAESVRESLVDEDDKTIKDTLRVLLRKLPKRGMVSVSSE